MRRLIFLGLLLISQSLKGASDYYAGNGYLPDDVSLSDIMFVGAHNSSFSKADGWVYYQQRVDVRDQWRKHGVRAFKIAIHYFDPDNTVKGKALQLVGKSRGDPFVALCHEYKPGTNCLSTQAQRLGRDPEPATKYFKRLRKLLESDPDEVAILFIETKLRYATEDNGMKGNEGQESANLWKALEKSGLDDHIYYIDGYYRTRDWPTLGELRDANRRLVVILARPYEGLSYTKLLRETEFDLTMDYLESDGPEDMRGGARDLSGKSRFFKVNHFLEVSIPKDSETGFLLKFVPKTFHVGKREVVVTDYDYLNSYELLKKRVKRASKWQGRMPNVLLIDFVDSGAHGGPQRVVWEYNQRLLEED